MVVVVAEHSRHRAAPKIGVAEVTPVREEAVEAVEAVAAVHETFREQRAKICDLQRAF